MCGICGKLIFKDSIPATDSIRAMCNTIVHRGPDDEGIYTAPHIGLGQARLSIIDLSRDAAAPLPNEDGSVWLVCNGEIYNFKELRSELEGKGHHFRTKTDIEVIVHLYEEYGIDCLKKMRGMFAFALWDARGKQLFAARDRLGKKPLCYAKTPYSLVFGSEIKAVTIDPDISVSPNYQAIDSYLTYAYVPSPYTAFEGVHKLQPGHYLTCSSAGRVNINRYWSPPTMEKTDMDEHEIEQELIERLREAVKLRMVADVPLGALLSGGIDSTAIVALMTQESSSQVKTFSIGFEDNDYNELPYARLLADRYGTEHHELIVKPNAAETLPLLVKHYNEPFADSSALPTYYVAQMTRKYVTVALSGDGGDENFAGYNRYKSVMQWSKFDTFPLPMKYEITRRLQGFVDILPYRNSVARLSRGLKMLRSKLPDRYILEMTMLKEQEKRIVYSQPFADYLRKQNHIDLLATFPWDETMDGIDWMMRHDQKFYLPDNLMVKTDIASMANSLEVRCPFLDHHFVEFAATIPSKMKLGKDGGKAILKNAVKDLLPPEIINKPKSGFGIPLAKWFREDLSDMLRGILLDQIAAKRNLFNISYVEKMVNEHIDGRRDWNNRLWAFLFLELWFREFID